MQETLDIIGKNIRTARREKYWNQENLAHEVNLQKGAISKIENGKVENLTIVRLDKIAKALGKNIVILLLKNDVKTDFY